MSGVLKWPDAALTVAAGDASWRPSVLLHNPTDGQLVVSGWFVATGVLLDPTGRRVPSRQHQPYPMPAALRRYRVGPHESQTIAVGLSLQPCEIAALTPGRYRLIDVRWGELRAPDVAVTIG